MNPLKLAGLLVSLLRASKSTQAFLYGFWNEELGMLGASPEVLFRLKERDRPLLETVALAGTLGDHPSVEAFLQDPKEIHEHGLVTEGIRQALEPFGKIHLGTMRAQECGKLTHLMTPIEVELRQHQSVDELVAALHPTPALGGFPKQEAWRWLEEYAKRIPRGRYGAPAGVLRAGGREMSCYVAIRGMQWNANGFHIGAGCGVVKASRAENELAEIERKMSAICHLMGIEYALV
ncbi:MAG: chorismate-binding protein [Chlamydiia bacterium]|nr:chorismate-binding protein [Chlamydiia bacterium]